MPGLGTLVNMGVIIIGGVIGLFIRDRLTSKFQSTLLVAIGTCVLFIGILGAIKEAVTVIDGHVVVTGIMMMVITFVLGTVVGEILDLDKGLENFGIWLRKKTRNDGESNFIEGFLTASFTVCVGAMAIIGSIQDAFGNPSILFAKGTMDSIVVMTMTASLGKGCIYSAIPVGIVQGLVTLLAVFIAPWLTPEALSNISLTGSMLIFLVGVNILWNMKIRIANMLPTIIFAAISALVNINF